MTLDAQVRAMAAKFRQDVGGISLALGAVNSRVTSEAEARAGALIGLSEAVNIASDGAVYAQSQITSPRWSALTDAAKSEMTAGKKVVGSDEVEYELSANAANLSLAPATDNTARDAFTGMVHGDYSLETGGNRWYWNTIPASALWVDSGSPEIPVVPPNGLLNPADGVSSWIGAHDKHTAISVGSLLASVIAPANFSAGDIITVKNGGHQYDVTLSGEDLITDGGVKLKVRSEQGGNLNIAAFGCDLSDSSVNDDVAFAKALAASILSSTRLSHPGGYLTLTSTDQLGQLRMSGVGWWSAARYGYASAAYAVDTNFKGSVIRVTGESGVGISLGSSTEYTYSCSLRDMLVIGPGSGTTVGILWERLVHHDTHNLVLANFPIALRLAYSLHSLNTQFGAWGNDVGVHFSNIDGNNVNHWIGHDFIANNTDLLVEFGNENSFNRGGFENARVNHWVVDTSGGGSVRNLWIEENHVEGNLNAEEDGPFMTGKTLKFVGGNNIAGISVRKNELKEVGPIEMIGGTANRGHVIEDNNAKGTTLCPVPINIYTATTRVRNNTGMPITDHTRNADIFVSGSFTATLTGCTTLPTTSVLYERQGTQVILTFPNLLGESNGSGCTVTGIPINLYPIVVPTGYVACRVQTNGVSVAGIIRIEANGTASLSASTGGSGFSASGQKGILGSTISYSLRTR